MASRETSTSGWIPALIALGLAGLVIWHVNDEDEDEPEPAGVSTAQYYLQKPYFVVDVTIPEGATHVGFLDGAEANRLDLKKDLPTLHAVKTRSTDPFFVEVVEGKSSSDTSSVERLRVWRQVPLATKPTPNQQLEWFQALNGSFWEVTTKDKKKKERRLTNVFIPIPEPDQNPTSSQLIRDQDIPLIVPDGLIARLYPKKFDFDLILDRLVPVDETNPPYYKLRFTPPDTIPGRNNVRPVGTRWTIEEGGKPADAKNELNNPVPLLGATEALFPILEDPENEANLFILELYRGTTLVGIDAIATCEGTDECDAIECRIDPGSCPKPMPTPPPPPPLQSRLNANNSRKLFRKR